MRPRFHPNALDLRGGDWGGPAGGLKQVAPLGLRGYASPRRLASDVPHPRALPEGEGGGEGIYESKVRRQSGDVYGERRDRKPSSD